MLHLSTANFFTCIKLRVGYESKITRKKKHLLNHWTYPIKCEPSFRTSVHRNYYLVKKLVQIVGLYPGFEETFYSESLSKNLKYKEGHLHISEIILMIG